MCTSSFILEGIPLRSPNLKAKHSHWYPLHPYKTYTIGANVLPCMLNMYKLIQFTLFEIMYCISVQYAYFFPVLFFTYERSSTPTEYCKKMTSWKKICRLSFQILIFYFILLKKSFYFLPKKDLPGLLNIVKKWLNKKSFKSSFIRV